MADRGREPLQEVMAGEIGQPVGGLGDEYASRVGDGGPTPMRTTLDEPVIDTIKRDVKAVFQKFTYVLVPRPNPRLLHDWDLWGPGLLTITLALVLRASAEEHQKSEVFTGVFVILWLGSVVITLNNQLLGGTLSFGQTLTVLGYCLLPLVLTAILLQGITILFSHIVLRLLLVCLGFGWAIFASMAFVRGSGPSNRRALIVYPIVLFYFVIAWLILSDIHG